MGERQSIAQKGVRAIDARNWQLDMAQMLQKPVFALPGCQRMSVNTLLCDSLGLADKKRYPTPRSPANDTNPKQAKHRTTSKDSIRCHKVGLPEIVPTSSRPVSAPVSELEFPETIISIWYLSRSI